MSRNQNGQGPSFAEGPLYILRWRWVMATTVLLLSTVRNCAPGAINKSFVHSEGDVCTLGPKQSKSAKGCTASRRLWQEIHSSYRRQDCCPVGSPALAAPGLSHKEANELLHVAPPCHSPKRATTLSAFERESETKTNALPNATAAPRLVGARSCKACTLRPDHRRLFGPEPYRRIYPP